MWCAGDAVWSQGARRQRVVRAEDIHSVPDNGEICPLLQPHWRRHCGHHHKTSVRHSRVWRQSVALSSLSSHHFWSNEGSCLSSWCNVTISVVVTFFSSQFQRLLCELKKNISSTHKNFCYFLNDSVSSFIC